MDAKDMIRQSFQAGDMIVGMYLNDLDEGALLLRPVAGMNTIAWQLGHLISSERKAVEEIKPGSCPALPEGFEAMHDRAAHDCDDPSKFLTKDQYLDLWKAQRAATLAALDALPDADLDAPAPERMRSYAPTVGHVFNMTGGIHPLMHAGQFVAVRRAKLLPIAM